MNYTQLTKEKKAQIDILLDQGLSMRKVAEIMGISHSTISRYKANIYKKRSIDIKKKYDALVRRFIPKGNSMKLVTQYYLDNISFEINSMPRKIFDYKCAYDIELKYK